MPGQGIPTAPPTRSTQRLGTLMVGQIQGGGSVELWVSKFDSVKDVKEQVAREFGISPNELTFSFGGQEMDSSRHLMRDPYAADGIGDSFGATKGTTIDISCSAKAQSKLPRKKLDVANYTESQLEGYFKRVFTIADADGNGTLDKEEMSTLISATGFNFSDAKVQEIIAAADANMDGLISYEEFVPLMIAMLRPKKLNAGNYSDEQLETYFMRIFSAADLDGNGVLDSFEVANLLLKTGFRFTEDEVGELVKAADTNNDGVLSYKEFVPLMIEMLKGQTLKVGNYTEEHLMAYFARLFMIGDTNGDGVLSPDEIRVLLGKTAFRFSREFIDELIVVADINQDGVIEYEEFVPMMVEVLAPKQLNLANYTEAQLRKYFTQLFEMADEDGNGVLDAGEVEHLLSSTGFKFSKVKIAEVMASADTNHDGVLDYGEFVHMLLKIL